MLDQRTDAWTELRKTMIGASDTPIIMGVSPWKTGYQLWLEKMGLEKDITNYAMERGIRREPECLEAFNKATGLQMQPEVVFSDEYDFMMASLDGISPCRKYIVEIKNIGEDDHALALDGHVPPRYYPQLQKQMLVTKLDMVYYYSCCGDKRVILEVHRDQDYMDKIICEEKKFYSHMIDFIAPPLEERDYVLVTNGAWLECAREYQRISQEVKRLSIEEEKYKNMLIAMSGNKNSKGAGLKLSRISRKGVIDYTQIPEIKNMDLEAYRKPASFYWTVKVEKTVDRNYN
ncbi:COG5377 Phage-related protein, predicted endonuclease [uncultured Caudovirales phage]|uniref:COG5377 Phage-related protein, predicted endonuclease n=1 Tax=uncultured Caudovirales phage TaxID=2100421 RepID=A0A6J5P2J4_9CAUD|nr:COG5377 Phage-related protein, predicted endonuclease [uncultured Caudovirales phage]